MALVVKNLLVSAGYREMQVRTLVGKIAWRRACLLLLIRLVLTNAFSVRKWSLREIVTYPGSYG